MKATDELEDAADHRGNVAATVTCNWQHCIGEQVRNGEHSFVGRECETSPAVLALDWLVPYELSVCNL